MRVGAGKAVSPFSVAGAGSCSFPCHPLPSSFLVTAAPSDALIALQPPALTCQGRGHSGATADGPGLLHAAGVSLRCAPQCELSYLCQPCGSLLRGVPHPHSLEQSCQWL